MVINQSTFNKISGNTKTQRQKNIAQPLMKNYITSNSRLFDRSIMVIFLNLYQTYPHRGFGHNSFHVLQSSE